MAKKQNPTIVGKMKCGSCGSIMEVRERSNGRKLLYTYCPNCKVDQRSSTEIQNFWRNNMVNLDHDITVIEDKPSQETPLNTESNPHKNSDVTEWAPETLPIKSEIIDQSNGVKFVNYLIPTLLSVGLLCIGIKMKKS